MWCMCHGSHGPTEMHTSSFATVSSARVDSTIRENLYLHKSVQAPKHEKAGADAIPDQNHRSLREREREKELGALANS